MLNIASVNMPKIKPKNHQDSQFQVFCWSCRDLQCVWTAGREDLQALPRDWRCPWQTQVGQAVQDNCSRRQLAGPIVKSQTHVNRLTGPGGVDASHCSTQFCFVKNCKSDSCSQWSPRLYCCPDTSAKQETTKKLGCVRQGPQPDGRLDSRKVAENLFFRWIVSWAPAQAPPILSTTLRGPSGPPVHPENFEGERLGFGVTSNTKVPGRSVRWMVTLIVPNINRFLSPSPFPTTRGVRFFNRMELLAIPQVPLCSFSGGRRSRSFNDGQHSLQIWILLSISGEELGGSLEDQAEEHWGALGCLQGGLPCHPRRLHQQALRLSAKPDGNCSAGQTNPYKILIT